MAIPVVVLVALAALGGLLSLLGVTGSSVTVSDITYTATNPSTLKVSWTVHGDPGDPGDTVACHIRDTDASRKYDGRDYSYDIVLDENTGGRTSWIPLSIGTRERRT